MDNVEDIYIEINPVDQVNELCNIFKGYHWEIHKAGDQDYEYLEADSLCITVLNPYSDFKMYIDLDEEFTLSYHAFHSHYSPWLGEYNDMLKTLRGFLNNEICSASLYHGESRKWLASACISREESLNSSVRETFSFVYKTPEFKKKLDSGGGQVHYSFWNPVDDKVIEIDRKD